ncbi:MAG: ParB/RepB/Spo0J family partition protein [Thermoplasmata archaeon]|nr:ParB/RepB/Spo0J family partition protein [Thermoplasmata archaeon]
MTEIHINQLVITKDIRISADAVSDEELLTSIQEHGIRVDLLVRPHPDQQDMYEVWDGRRRFRLGKIAGIVMFPCNIRKMENLEAHIMAFTLNDQRKEMSSVELGLWVVKLLEEYPELTQVSLGKKLGHSESWMSRHVAVAKQYLGTPEKDREHLPRSEKALRELRRYSPEEQKRIIEQSKLRGEPPSAAELMRQAGATMTSREIFEKWPYEGDDFLIHMLEESAGFTLGNAAERVKLFRAKGLDWQKIQRQFQQPRRSDVTVQLYAKLSEWYPPELIDYIEKNVGPAVSIETWKSRVIRFMRKMFQKSGEDLRQSVLEEFRL